MDYLFSDDAKSLKCKKEKERRKKENEWLDKLKMLLLQHESSCSSSKMEKVDVIRHAYEFCSKAIDEKQKQIAMQYILAQTNTALMMENKRLTEELLSLSSLSSGSKFVPSTSPDSALSSPQSSSFSSTSSLSPQDTPKNTRTWKPYE